MTTVSKGDKDAMARLLSIMDGKKPPPLPKNTTNPPSNQGLELLGPGVTSKADIDAMANILSKFKVIDSSSIQHVSDPILEEAIQTKKVSNGVKVGKYQIMIKEDTKRLAGKQYYSIYHTATNDIIADDISLYETALTVVRLLNNGKFINNGTIRKLFEHDDAYTSHRVDALMYKRRLLTKLDPIKQDIYESRYQASLDRAMSAKKQIKNMGNDR